MIHTGDGPLVKVPVDALSPEALIGLIDEYITREGTDYGHRDHGLESKRASVMRQLQDGEAVITFDPRTETTNIVPEYVLRGR